MATEYSRSFAHTPYELVKLYNTHNYLITVTEGGPETYIHAYKYTIMTIHLQGKLMDKYPQKASTL